jgi:hypothetical protein
MVLAPRRLQALTCARVAAREALLRARLEPCAPSAIPGRKPTALP